MGELKVIDGGTGSAGKCGAVDVLGVVGTKIGPADGANDTAVGMECVGIAEVDARLVGGGTKRYDKLHWSRSTGEGFWVVSWFCFCDCALALVFIVGTFDVGGSSLKKFKWS